MVTGSEMNDRRWLGAAHFSAPCASKPLALVQGVMALSARSAALLAKVV
jgi:hypothetical protein